MEGRRDGPRQGELQNGLKRRHMSMIALGGVIGAGLFVGSGVVMNQTGPAAIVSFVITGVIVVLVMRMLGEMAVAYPAVGGFYEYSRLALGNMAGFLTGWMYWYFWVIVVALEAVAGATLLKYWLPDVPSWIFTLALIVIFTITNLLSVRNYGEFEFWFASIKVAAIVVFLFLGALFVLGFWPGGGGDGFSNLTAHGE
jgi:GABA permease